MERIDVIHVILVLKKINDLLTLDVILGLHYIVIIKIN
jgi:hypothetical protein